MGVAILVGMMVFLALNSILALAQTGGMMGMMGGGGTALVMTAGSVMSAFTTIFLGLSMGVFVADAVAILLAMIVCIVGGVAAGAMARGSAGRGFMAGFAGVLVGYYLSLMLFVVVLASMGGLGFMSMMPILVLIGSGLITPIIAGVIGGIGGAIMGAIFASPGGISAGYAQPVSPVTTTIIQAPPMAAQPVIIQGSSEKATKTKVVICPACKAENEYGSTFCQSCGTRIK